MPHKGERPLLMTMAFGLSNEILTFLRASPNPPTLNPSRLINLMAKAKISADKRGESGLKKAGYRNMAKTY